MADALLIISAGRVISTLLRNSRYRFGTDIIEICGPNQEFSIWEHAPSTNAFHDNTTLWTPVCKIVGYAPENGTSVEA